MSFDRTAQTAELSDGRRLGFAEYGNPAGKPVFHFHGSAGSRLERPPCLAVLSELGVRFISVDRPGHGLSDPAPRRTLRSWAGDVSTLADKLGAETFHVEGYSSGGAYALACAHALPGRVTGAATVSSVAPWIGSDTSLPLLNRLLAETSRYAPPLTYVLRWIARRMVLADPEHVARRVMATIPAADREALYAAENLQVFAAAIVEGFRQGSSGVAQDDVLLKRDWGFDLAEINVQVDVWHGDADVNVPIAAAERLVHTIPRARARRLGGEGHFFIYPRWREILVSLVTG